MRGIRQLSCTCEAAYVGAWLQCAPHVVIFIGEVPSGEVNPTFADLHEAIDDMKDLFGIDVLETLRITLQDIQAKGKEKRTERSLPCHREGPSSRLAFEPPTARQSHHRLGCCQQVRAGSWRLATGLPTQQSHFHSGCCLSLQLAGLSPL